MRKLVGKLDSAQTALMGRVVREALRPLRDFVSRVYRKVAPAKSGR